MVGKDRHRVMVNIEKGLRERLDVMRMRFNSERGRNVSESKFYEMCLAEWFNFHRDRSGVVDVSDRDLDFE